MKFFTAQTSGFALFGLSILLTASLCEAQTYSITPLNGSGNFINQFSGINSSTQVAGYLLPKILTANSPGPQAYVWQASQVTYLNALHGQTSSQTAVINSSGQVAGTSCAAKVACSAVIWNGTVPTDIGPGITPGAISASGDVYGSTQLGRDDYGPEPGGPVVWHQGRVSQLPLPQIVDDGYEIVQSQLYGGNSAGTVVGYIILQDLYTSEYLPQMALMWQGPNVTSLPLTDPFAINDHDVVAGDLYDPTAGGPTAVTWNGTTLTTLPKLSGAVGQAYAINSSGDVVGRATAADGSQHAVLWTRGTVVDLNPKLQAGVPASVVGTAATAIDNQGRIVIGATDRSTGTSLVYLLTPSNVLLPTAEPVFSAIPRTYGHSQAVTLSDPTPNAIIYFTTDGTSPTLSSPRYTAPIMVGSTMTIKAIAAAGTGYLSSEIASATYTIAIPTSTTAAVDLAATNNVVASSNTLMIAPNGGIDGLKNALAADELGSSLNWGGVDFPFGTPDTKNATANATIQLPTGHYGALKLLAVGINGNHPNESFTVSYTDGSSQVLNQSVSDWSKSQAYSGEALALTMAHRVSSSGSFSYGPYHVYGYSLPVDPAKAVASLTTPAAADVVVLSVAEAEPQGGDRQVDLYSSFNVIGAYDAGLPVDARALDGLGNAYAEELLGTALSWSGSIFEFGSAGVPNAVSNSTLKLSPGHFSTLKLLAAGVNGNHASQQFKINYTDGTSQIIDQSVSDWHTPQHYAGEAIASSMAYRRNINGDEHTGPYSLYGYTFTVDPTKSVESLTLPPTTNVLTLAITVTP